MSIRKSLVTYTREEALAYHANNFGGGGKIEVISKVSTQDVKDLTLAYSPGVAEVCREIVKEPDRIHDYTTKDNLVAKICEVAHRQRYRKHRRRASFYRWTAVCVRYQAQARPRSCWPFAVVPPSRKARRAMRVTTTTTATVASSPTYLRICW